MPRRAEPVDLGWTRPGPEPAGTYKGKDYYRYVRVIKPGEMRQCVEVDCVNCPEWDVLYGDPFIGKTQGEVQFGNEGWSFTADGWMCPLCVAERPRGVKLARKAKN